MRTVKKMHLDMVMGCFDDDTLISFIFAIGCTVHIYNNYEKLYMNS